MNKALTIIGVVSVLTVLAAACGGGSSANPPRVPPETVITFADENLRVVVRESLIKALYRKSKISQRGGVLRTDPTIGMTASDLAQLKMLNLDSGIADLTGLEHLVNLNLLDLSDVGISDVSVLGEITTLTTLVLSGNQISDISALAGLTSLIRLDLDGNQITDISVLADMSELGRLNLTGNQISDISPLVANSGLGSGDRIQLVDNNLDLSAGSDDLKNIEALKTRGSAVDHDPLASGP